MLTRRLLRDASSADRIPVARIFVVRLLMEISASKNKVSETVSELIFIELA